MKEYDKWWDNEGQSYLNYEVCSGLEIGCSERAWRAALEWINLQVCPEAWDVGDVEFDIKEELNEKIQKTERPDTGSN